MRSVRVRDFALMLGLFACAAPETARQYTEPTKAKAQLPGEDDITVRCDDTGEFLWGAGVSTGVRLTGRIQFSAESLAGSGR